MGRASLVKERRVFKPSFASELAVGNIGVVIEQMASVVYNDIIRGYTDEKTAKNSDPTLQTV